MKKHETPMLDQLEQGPWPSFISGIKKLRDEHQDDRINGRGDGTLRTRVETAVGGPFR